LKEYAVAATAQEIYQRYVWAGALTRNAEALAETFASDGVYEAPLVPAGHVFPRRLEGRDAIREGMADYYRRSTKVGRPVDADRTGYVLHTTTDPEVFVVEIDAAFTGPGEPATMALVQIFRVRDGKIVLLRDYFSPDEVD
jgi:ketosteroid isomerase-like protein